VDTQQSCQGFDQRPRHAGNKTVFLSDLYVKLLILPRQARDKHRESTQKTTVLLQVNRGGCEKLRTDLPGGKKTELLIRFNMKG
jgi:hypothetical protein